MPMWWKELLRMFRRWPSFGGRSLSLSWVGPTAIFAAAAPFPGPRRRRPAPARNRLVVLGGAGGEAGGDGVGGQSRRGPRLVDQREHLLHRRLLAAAPGTGAGRRARGRRAGRGLRRRGSGGGGLGRRGLRRRGRRDGRGSARRRERRRRRDRDRVD